MSDEEEGEGGEGKEVYPYGVSSFRLSCIPY